MRRDGSTSFGPNNKFGYFPSASVGWNVSDEPFLQDSKIINTLKLRASYGVIGNDKIPGGAFVSLLNGEGVYSSNNEVTQDDLLYGVAIGKIGNPDIRWEKQKSANIGFDASFLDRKIKLSVDAFSKRTEDLLLAPQVSGLIGPYAPGASTPVKNAGTVENKGIVQKLFLVVQRMFPRIPKFFAVIRKMLSIVHKFLSIIQKLILVVQRLFLRIPEYTNSSP